MDIIDKSALYGNKYNAFALCEYTRELKLIKQFIDIAENAIEKNKNCYTWSFEGICYYFAKTIVDYSKMAYDNVILGHFQTTYMTIRAIVENYVFLNIIINHNDKELWKYYLVYSYRASICEAGRIPTQKETEFLSKMYSDLKINSDFYTKQNNKTPYIEKNYGWTYQINKEFNFRGVSKLVDEIENHGFKMMSTYSHSTSFYMKLDGQTSVEKMMYTFTNIYIELDQMIKLYCLETVEDSFYDMSSEITGIIRRYIDDEEEFRNNKSE